jgi:hypothetical protein
MTFRMCASSRKTNGMLNTLSSSTTGPIAPTEIARDLQRADLRLLDHLLLAAELHGGYIWMLMRPLVSALSVLPIRRSPRSSGSRADARPRLSRRRPAAPRQARRGERGGRAQSFTKSRRFIDSSP